MLLAISESQIVKAKSPTVYPMYHYCARDSTEKVLNFKHLLCGRHWTMDSIEYQEPYILSTYYVPDPRLTIPAQ